MSAEKRRSCYLEFAKTCGRAFGTGILTGSMAGLGVMAFNNSATASPLSIATLVGAATFLCYVAANVAKKEDRTSCCDHHKPKGP